MQVRRPRAVLAGAALVLVAAVLPVQSGSAAPAPAPNGHYQGFGDAGGFLDILPPGQQGTLTAPELTQVAAATKSGDTTAYPPHVADQRTMYDDLNFATSITDSTLTDYYKDASFGVRAGDIARVFHPTRDVTVIRDKSFDVPHIFGRTRAATMFAEGYTTAEDRLFTMDLLRRVGRGTVSELVGTQGLGIDQGTITDSPYSETDLQAQIDALSRSGTEGHQTVADFRSYVAGVNAYLADAGRDPDHLLPAEYKILGQKPAPWKLTDVVATAANIGAIFGRGGGHELINSCGLATMTSALGGDATKARQVFDEVHLAASPAAPTTSSRTADYPTGLGRPDPAAVPAIDCASLHPAGGAAAPASTPAGTPATTGGLGTGSGSLGALAPLVDALLTAVQDGTTPPTSNAILVDGRHTATGRPIAVFGPQVGYQMPSFLVEKDVHGPGIDARGVGFAGVDAYVLLGRGRDYAWSATSSGADNTDTFVLRLCDPAGAAPTTSSTGYAHGGKCKAMQTFDHTERPAIVGGGASGAALTWTIQRAPDYGPVVQRGTLRDGTPIAIAQKRSTYGDEISSAIGFRRLNDPAVMKAGYPAFRTAAGAEIHFTFNWFYVDGVTIGYQHSCKCPLRARGVNPDLPVWGTGRWDWTGYLAASHQPYEVNPSKGYLTSWNNKQAPGFRASDSQFSYGAVQRVQLLNRGVERAFKAKAKAGLTRADVVTLMVNAATLDLRAVEVLPRLLALLAPGTEPANLDPRVLDLRERLEIWANATGGPHRHGTTRGAPYTDPVAIAAMDAWWHRLTAAMFGSAAGSPFDSLQLVVDDSPGTHGGSSFDEGSYSAVATDLSVVQGKPVPGAWSKAFCGGGAVDACRTLLWQSLASTVGALDQTFHSANVDDWQRAPADDEIRFQQVIAGMLPMEWQNRPTFQQVVQLRTRGVAGATSDSGGGGGALTIALAAVVGIAVAASALWWTRRRLAAAPTRR